MELKPKDPKTMKFGRSITVKWKSFDYIHTFHACPQRYQEWPWTTTHYRVGEGWDSCPRAFRVG